MMAETPETNNAPQGEPTVADKLITLTDEIYQEVFDALSLLDFAVSSRKDPTKEDKSVPRADIAAIKSFAAAIDVYASTSWKSDPSGNTNVTPKQASISEWTDFELAYQRLVKLTSPVTAATLKATAPRKSGQRSEAARFTYVIWVVTIGFIVFVVASEWAISRWGPVLDGEVEPAYWYSVLQITNILVPFAYGGLGACVFLLRSAHKYFHERSFDLLRKPEYSNRIILGVIGGGAIVLFVDQITTDDGNVIELSSAAMGFLAGYSTDFLFQTIERVIAAILPKVGLETVRRQAPPKSNIDVPVGDLTLKDLMDRYDSAEKSEDRAMYRALIEKLQSRL